MKRSLDILPTVGLGEIRLGSSREAIEQLLGLPDEIELHAEYEVWRFGAYFDLTFSAEVDYLLSCITTNNEAALLGGELIIGLTEAELLERFPFFCLDEDLDHAEANPDEKDYICVERELSVWLVDNKVLNVSLFPAFDASGQQPKWPN